jgi:hypothetical protein
VDYELAEDLYLRLASDLVSVGWSQFEYENVGVEAVESSEGRSWNAQLELRPALELRVAF